MIFVLMVVIGIVGSVAAKRAAEARMKALGEFASAVGMQFYPGVMNDTVAGGFLAQMFGDHSSTDEGRFLSRFAGLEPFGKGNDPEVHNLIYGKNADIDFAAFDYSYKTTSSDGKTTTTQTHPFGVVVARVPLVLPGLVLVPENFMLRLGTKLGMKELNFEVEEFNRRYFIQSTDDRMAYDLLHPKMIEHLMACPIRHWQIAGYQILIHQNAYYEPGEIGQIMNEIAGFARLIPGYVRQDRGFQANWQGPF